MGVSVVILAGGYGTRLTNVGLQRPKVLTEVEGKPILKHLFDLLAVNNILSITVCSGHQSHFIKDYVEKTVRVGVNVMVDKLINGTMSTLRQYSHCADFDGSDLLVLNGDTLLSFSPIAAVYDVINPSLDIIRLKANEVSHNFVSNMPKSSGAVFIKGAAVANILSFADVKNIEDIFCVRGVYSRFEILDHLVDGSFLDIGTIDNYLNREKLYKRMVGK